MAKKRKKRAGPRDAARRPTPAGPSKRPDDDRDDDVASSEARTDSSETRTETKTETKTDSPDARTRKRKRGKRDRRDDAPRATNLPPPDPEVRVRAMRIHEPTRPAFWFGFEISWAKLSIARVVIFGLLAIDAILQIAHAPRYGAGNFNVGHLPVFEQLAPGRVGYEVGQLALSYLFVLAVFGIATRWVVPIGAVLYAWLYFGSQLDSYQHHYLVALVLGIASFVPWDRPTDAQPSTHVRSWALRLLLIQIAIMYLWAAISKMDSAWIDGTTLGRQMTGSVRAFIDRTVGIQVASLAVIVVELVLAATIWLPRFWKLAAPLGLVFHLGIASTGLEIGLFAYLMLGFYILVVPDALWIAIAESAAGRSIRSTLARVAASRSIVWFGALLAAATGVALLTRFEHGLALAIAGTVAALALGHLRRRHAGVVVVAAAHLFAMALWLVVDVTGGVAKDYYRFWGGSQRRLGNLDVAERAYRSLLEVAPDDPNGHFQLGRILLEDANAPQRATEGLALVHEAQRLEPGRARAWLVEARWLARQGRIEDAQAKARQAVAADPSDSDARTLLQSLLQSRTATPDPR